MKRNWVRRFYLGSVLSLVICLPPSGFSETGLDKARLAQDEGRTAEVRATVAEFLREKPSDAAALLAAAQLLDLSVETNPFGQPHHNARLRALRKGEQVVIPNTIRVCTQVWTSWTVNHSDLSTPASNGGVERI